MSAARYPGDITSKIGEMAKEDAQTQQPRSLEVIYTLATRQIDEQLKATEGIDTKLGLVFGASSVVIGLLLTSLPSAKLESPSRLAILALPLLAYVIIVCLAFWGYRFLDIKYPPDIGKMYEEALFWDADVTKRQVLSNWVSAIQSNNETISSKVKWASLALYLLPVEVVLAVTASVVVHLP